MCVKQPLSATGKKDRQGSEGMQQELQEPPAGEVPLSRSTEPATPRTRQVQFTTQTKITWFLNEILHIHLCSKIK